MEGGFIGLSMTYCLNLGLKDQGDQGSQGSQGDLSMTYCLNLGLKGYGLGQRTRRLPCQ